MKGILIDPSVYEMIRTKCIRRTYRQFGVTSQELYYLLCVVASLNKRGRIIISQQVVANDITGRLKDKYKISQYCYHCLNKKLLGSYEYLRTPGSRCVGLSDYGCEVVRYYYSQLSELQIAYTKQAFTIPQIVPARVIEDTYRIAA